MTTYCFKCSGVREITKLKDVGPVYADSSRKRVVASQQEAALQCSHQKVIVTKLGARA